MAGLCLEPSRAWAAIRRQADRGELTILPRRTWTTHSPDARKSVAMDGVKRLTVHHTGIASASLRTMEHAKKHLRGIALEHRRRGWADIGYHYAIDPAGRVWEARPANLQGAHVRGENEHNLGVVLLGNFEVETPTAAARESLDRLAAMLLKRHSLSAEHLHTHRELAATLCPGRALQAHVAAARKQIDPK